jgi:hypothetical protein
VRVAILSSFPPEVCGIADYAQQQAERLSDEGVEVDAIPVAVLRAGGWRGGRRGSVRAVARRFAEADRAVIHYQIGLFKDETRAKYRWKVLAPQWALLRLLWRYGDKTEFVLHESYFQAVRSWVWLPFQFALAFLLYNLPATVVVHTEHERRLVRRRFLRRTEVRPHHADFAPRAAPDRAAARRLLGLDSAQQVFLCIGFFTAAKGFAPFAERFAAAVRKGLLGRDAHLHVVTSVRLESDVGGQASLDALRKRWERDGQVHVVDSYVSGDDFDTWLAAADVVVLPYLATYSSGVAARARLMGRTILAAKVGGLPEQLGSEDLAYGSDEDLDAAFVRLSAAAPATPAVSASSAAQTDLPST